MEQEKENSQFLYNESPSILTGKSCQTAKRKLYLMPIKYSHAHIQFMNISNIVVKFMIEHTCTCTSLENYSTCYTCAYMGICTHVHVHVR